MYELLCGKTPFSGETANELFDEIINKHPKMPQAMNFQGN